MKTEFRHVRGHVEVYQNGEFVVSADTESEARQFLQEMEDADGKM